MIGAYVYNKRGTSGEAKSSKEKQCHRGVNIALNPVHIPRNIAWVIRVKLAGEESAM